MVYIYSSNDCVVCDEESSFIKSVYDSLNLTGYNNISDAITYVDTEKNTGKGMEFVINCISPVQIPEIICIKSGKGIGTGDSLDESTKNTIRDIMSDCLRD